MQRKFTLGAILGAGGCFGLSVAILVGCANGSDVEAAGTSDLATLPVEASTGDENSAKLPGPSTQPTGDDAGNKADEDAGDGGGGGGTDSGKDAAADAGADSGGGGGGGCASPNTCVGATDLGSLSGDTGAGVVTQTGSGSKWFKVRITENDSTIIPISLRAKAELTSPPGTNFDVYVYVAGSTSTQECSAVSASSTTTGFDSALAVFGESESGLFSNGSDDSRTVTVEVRWVSGACSAATPWTLTIRGDTP